ncbi:dynein assembly factor 4, axonemal-like [Bradysia coprophila]|uniref:dynein assembly factor 4, axonemal-like n=1 Tax=Bradysia coprophila TaxID=38358 RepID=UPI00187DD3C2|nr:dynein assembly factor 4, axonemal-like [Bradysia coprophila]
MPILIKDYNWSQTDNQIVVKVPLKGVHKHPAVDIFTYETFIKINCSPFYFEVLLLHPIDETNSRCKILENEAKFILFKKTAEHWDSLELNCSKESRLDEKKEAIKCAQLTAEKKAEDRWNKKCELKRSEIHKEVDREAKIREEIDGLRKSEIVKKLEDIHKNKKEKLIALDMRTGDTVHHQQRTKTIDDSSPPNINSIRTAGNITVKFSARHFPTPQRESQEAAEQEWLMKQHEARKATGFVEEDLRPEERNPQWLKDKGDDFLSKKNFLAAISAFSTAIKTNPKYFELYLNRAAAHFQMGNYYKCVADCSAAYDLITPALLLNAKARAICLARRGAALCKLGMLKQGYDELVAAMKLTPDDEELKRDAEMVKCELDKRNAVE